MGFVNRLVGKDEAEVPMKAAVVGSGEEAGLLASAYSVRSDIELVHARTIVPADGVIRRPSVEVPAIEALDEVIRTPGLEAVELVAPLNERAGLAASCIKAGLFTSVAPPAGAKELFELESLAKAYNTALRIRMPCFYYEPYTRMKRLLERDELGMPMGLKLSVKRGKGSRLPEKIEPAEWIAEHEIGFLALGPWLLGAPARVHARLEASSPGRPLSSVIAWRCREKRYGHMQLDFCPHLQVRTFTEPVHRAVELTCAGGMAFASRGEGQLMRMPALWVRGKSTATAFEMLRDDWRSVYDALAAETVKVTRSGAAPVSGPGEAAAAMNLLALARESAARGDEARASA